MSQDYQDSTKKPRRATRTQRNRPVLVTANENEQSNQPVQELTAAEAIAGDGTSTGEVEEVSPAPAPKARRLPAFFSTVGKRESDAKQLEEEAAQARIARAARTKAAPENTKKTETKETQQPKTSATNSTTGRTGNATRPSTGFKTRYLIGIAIYIFAAQFIGQYEILLMQKFGLDHELSRFNLFGGTVIVRSSTLLFLATLIIILVLLARFDLIPRNLASATGTQTSRSGQGSSDTTEGARRVPQTMRQGVSGADDDLYREYRANQRREKRK